MSGGQSIGKMSGEQSTRWIIHHPDQYPRRHAFDLGASPFPFGALAFAFGSSVGCQDVDDEARAP